MPDKNREFFKQSGFTKQKKNVNSIPSFTANAGVKTHFNFNKKRPQ